jgi:hypothetical protein
MVPNEDAREAVRRFITMEYGLPDSGAAILYLRPGVARAMPGPINGVAFP